jgi:uncharacterized surface protein with fasciclin (FAS1) repeats
MALACFGIFTTSCVDKPDVIGTFSTEMMGEYVANRTEDFSEFKKLLEVTEVMGLLNAYGEYTLFAPTNEAMYAFYADQGKSSLDDFSTDTLKKIAYDHIIKGYIVKTENFVDGLMPFLTMSDRFIATESRPENNGLVYYINEKSAIFSGISL